jgi:hypothetical protein
VKVKVSIMLAHESSTFGLELKELHPQVSSCLCYVTLVPSVLVTIMFDITVKVKVSIMQSVCIPYSEPRFLSA